MSASATQGGHKYHPISQKPPVWTQLQPVQCAKVELVKLRHRAIFRGDRSYHYTMFTRGDRRSDRSPRRSPRVNSALPRYRDFFIFQDGGRLPSWIWYARIWAIHEGHFVVPTTVPNLVGIGVAFSIICKF